MLSILTESNGRRDLQLNSDLRQPKALRAPGQSLAVAIAARACIDEFKLNSTAAAAIHFYPGTTCCSSNFTFIL